MPSSDPSAPPQDSSATFFPAQCDQPESPRRDVGSANGAELELAMAREEEAGAEGGDVTVKAHAVSEGDEREAAAHLYSLRLTNRVLAMLQQELEAAHLSLHPAAFERLEMSARARPARSLGCHLCAPLLPRTRTCGTHSKF